MPPKKEEEPAMLCLYFNSSLGHYARKKAEYSRGTLHSRRHDSYLRKMSQRELQKWFFYSTKSHFGCLKGKRNTADRDEH
ncbi:hypothetical protein OESDEN_25536 [Oesophagostomum dentatum]|uniref:Uncharacterized protein n=1 Tax=Oesophagostomum dentatum TaxID=61180 RepID=A0A0B1RP73_OESDE|nr:hypothetical protein OESDEN_25536 [Oesophagostomum dentatum]